MDCVIYRWKMLKKIVDITKQFEIKDLPAVFTIFIVRLQKVAAS